MSETSLIVGVGDIHGRFQRVGRWLDALEQALGRAIDAVLAVGDVEAFATADDHRRKAAKRTMPAEFVDFASGESRMSRPFAFIGGNNEDFETLHVMPEGGDVAPGVHYLGRVGEATLAGVRVAWLSGIHAPRWYETPLQPPATVATRKQAGYFRAPEVERLRGAHRVQLLLTHEWPRGLFLRTEGKPFRPWMGNVHTRALVDTLRPAWLLCGFFHERLAATCATTIRPPRGLLDEAAEPDGAILWMEWKDGEARRVGWESAAGGVEPRPTLGAARLVSSSAACSCASGPLLLGAGRLPKIRLDTRSAPTSVSDAVLTSSSSCCARFKSCDTVSCASGSKCIQLSTGQFCLPSCASSDCPTGLVCGPGGTAGNVCSPPAAAPAAAVSCSAPVLISGGAISPSSPRRGCQKPIVSSSYSPTLPAVGVANHLGMHQVGEADRSVPGRRLGLQRHLPGARRPTWPRSS